MEEACGIDKPADAGTLKELNHVENPTDTIKPRDMLEELEESNEIKGTMENLDDGDEPSETAKLTRIAKEIDMTDSSGETVETPTEVEEEKDEVDEPTENMENTQGKMEDLDEIEKTTETKEKQTDMLEDLDEADKPAETMEKSRMMVEEVEETVNQAETVEKSAETKKDPKETLEKLTDISYIIYQAIGSAAVGMGGMVASLAMGYTSPALPSMRADPNFSITEEQESWVGAVMPACGLLGSVATGPLVDYLGRRTTLLHLTWPFMLSWVMIAMSGGVGGVVLGRMLAGFCVGIQTAAGSVFLPEIVQVDLRNTMYIFPSVLGTLGLLVSFAAGQYLTWRGLAWLGAALCVPILALLYPLPETPHHLTSTGKKEESVAALQKLRRSAQDAEREQQEISSSCSQDSTDVSVWEIMQPPNLWPVSVGAALMVAQQTTGINVIVFYASTILEANGGGMDSGTSSVLLGLVNFFSTFLAMIVVAKYKRRFLMTISTIVVVVSLLTLSLFFWAQTVGGTVAAIAQTLSFVPVVALLTYMVGFGLAWGPIPWVFLGEGMPSRVRGKAVAVVAGVNWASTFLTTKTFGWSLASLGAHNTFLGYAVATILGTTLILPSMPETYGQSTAQMDKLYLEAANKKQQ